MNKAGKHQVLLVEDEMLVAAMIEEALVDSGYQVVCASRVSHALQLIQEQTFQAAVLDINIGNDVVYPVAALLQERNIPFVFASSVRADTLPVEYATRPMLEKPFRLRHLLETVATLLEGQGPAAAVT
jgi:DNA-binding response OmpR family regulator